MTARAKQVKFKGQVSHRHEANPALTEPGAAVLVFRGVARSLAMACPDGCGEQLTINLDPRSGPAWRFYEADEQGISVFPSVWRDTGCGSHFIVWRSKIFWCDWHEPLDESREDVKQRTLSALSHEFVPYLEIADALDIVPWAVLSACASLTRSGLAENGRGKQQGHYRRISP
ncbi:DUF6527 family protein [Variovorax sp. LjRoot290]|uniref:DUF6527 family protein n=1 Tax=Variovorax sp. LjRoot290 TaxID=3342316 RepID=UPI003ECFDC55